MMLKKMNVKTLALFIGILICSMILSAPCAFANEIVLLDTMDKAIPSTQVSESTRSASLSLKRIYDLSNVSKYQLHDSQYSGGWLGIAKHKYQTEVNSLSGELKYKSSKSSVATINSTGLITCKKNGITTITITDKFAEESYKFGLRVLKNESNYIDGLSWDDEVLGIYSKSKRVYMKGSVLYIDMYIMNATNVPIRNVGMQSIYLATPWTNECDEYTDSSYKYVGKWNGKIATIRPFESRYVKIKIGKVDPNTIYLRNADAYCKGGRVRGSVSYGFDY